MLIPTTYYNYEPAYVYDGGSLLTPLIDLASRAFGKFVSSGASEVAKEAAKKVAKEAGSAALSEGSKRVAAKARSKVAKMLGEGGKVYMDTPRLGRGLKIV